MLNKRVWGAVASLVVVAAVVLYLVLGKGAPRTGGESSDGSATGARSGSSRTRDQATSRSSIRGRVTDAKGPLANATVCAATRIDVTACATTDAQGTYAIEELSAGAYRVSAVAPQHRPGRFADGGDRTRAWIYLAAGQVRDKVDLVLRAGVLVRGKVNDVNGGPIAGAHVRVKADDSWATLGVVIPTWSPPVTSDRDGGFQVWVAPGPVEVSASADGYADGGVEGTAPTEVVILLMPEGSLAGRVVDAQGQPVADALVEANYVDTLRKTHSDVNGAFTIGRLPAARYEVSARAPNGYGQHAGLVEVSLGRQTSDVTIQLLAAARVSGTVMLGDTPCAEPRVELRDVRTEVEHVMISDGNGAVHVDGLLPGDYVLHPRCHGALSKEEPLPHLTVTDKDQSGLVWKLQRGGTIHGRVTTEAGTAVVDAEVKAVHGGWSESATSGDDGSYRLEGIEPGIITVTATALDGGSAEGSLVLKDDAALDLEVNTAARINGTVVDALGRPVKGLEVRADPKEAKRAEGLSLSSVKTDATFEIPVRPGSYHVYAAVDWSHPIEPGVDVTVAAGQAVTIQLKVPAQDGVIKGSVVDSTGAPISDAVVTATTASGFWDTSFAIGWNEHPTLTAADGSFAITDLGPGAYTVTAARPGAPPVSQRDVAPGATIELSIHKGASVVGTVTYSDKRSPREIGIDLRDEAKTFYRHEDFLGTKGAFHIDDLPAGVLKLTATDPERGFVATSLVLKPGETRIGVALVLAEMVEVKGRAVDDKQQPLAGVFIVVTPELSLVNMMRAYDNFLHLTAPDGTFAIKAPVGPGTLSASSFGLLENRERCQAEVKLVVDGPKEVGDIAVRCTKF